MQKGGKGGNAKKKDEEEKKEFAPPREPLERPQLSPEQELVELKIAHSLKSSEYFPAPYQEKIVKIFALFDRDEDGFINFAELKVGYSLKRNCWSRLTVYTKTKVFCVDSMT